MWPGSAIARVAARAGGLAALAVSKYKVLIWESASWSRGPSGPAPGLGRPNLSIRSAIMGNAPPPWEKMNRIWGQRSKALLTQRLITVRAVSNGHSAKTEGTPTLTGLQHVGLDGWTKTTACRRSSSCHTGA